MSINTFIGEYRFLSNFHKCQVILDGRAYPSVEHAYQAAKTDNQALRFRIRHLELPIDAKRLGSRIPPRENWDQAKVAVMQQLLQSKFRNPELRRSLLGTGDEELVEGCWWGDEFWGRHDGRGQNHLGRLLMELRSDIRKDLTKMVEHPVPKEFPRE